MKGAYSFKMRATAFVVAVLFVISLFIADLFRIQVIDAQEYASQNIYYSSANTQIEAIRGQIIDTNGKPLVYSSQSNTIYIDGSYFPKASKKQERNEIMLSLLRLLKENEVEYNFDDFLKFYKENESKLIFEDGLRPAKSLTRNIFSCVEKFKDCRTPSTFRIRFSKVQFLILSLAVISTIIYFMYKPLYLYEFKTSILLSIIFTV